MINMFKLKVIQTNIWRFDEVFQKDVTASGTDDGGGAADATGTDMEDKVYGKKHQKRSPIDLMISLLH